MAIDLDAVFNYVVTLERTITLASAELSGGDAQYAERILQCMAARIDAALEAIEAAARARQPTLH
jgi:hypothetical protein